MRQDIPFVELECFQFTKDGQAACGDDFQWERIENGDRTIAVLSDGLGSGIKANLLANMTTTMAIKFMESNMDILQSAETIMDTLPVCEVRKISYATFSIVDMTASSGRTRVIEMGNPSCIHLRGTQSVEPISTNTLVSSRWPDRKMTISELKLELGDRLIVCSDGITQAGLGGGGYKFGWREKGCLEFASSLIAHESTISAKDLSQAIAFKALSLNPDRRCVDDMSCMVIYLRRPRTLRILTGPPFHQEDDRKFALLAASGADETVICGGTTANIISRELGTKVEVDFKLMKLSKGLPPPGRMEKVGLATEGILTLTRVASDLEKHSWDDSPIAAREIIIKLVESDLIEFVVGTKVNEAHQDPSLPIDLEIRRNIIKRLKDVLENEYRKKVEIRYF